MNVLLLSKSQIKSNWKVWMNQTIHHLSNIYKTSIASLQKVKLNYTCENKTLSFKEMHILLLPKKKLLLSILFDKVFSFGERRKKRIKMRRKYGQNINRAQPLKVTHIPPFFQRNKSRNDQTRKKFEIANKELC